MAFDTQAAAEAGHSIDDQINHLAKLHNYDSAAAEAAGFTKEAQLQYLAGLDEPAKAASPSMLDKVAEYFGITEEMPDAPIGAAIGAVAGPSMGPAIGGAIDTAVNKVAGKVAPPGTAKPTGVPQGVMNWYEQESGNPYAGGKTKEAAYEKGQRAAGEPIQSRGSKIKIRKGNLGIDNQLEPQKPTLAQKAAANIVNAEKVNSPSFTRRMLGTGVMGGELGSMKEEIEKGNYGRAGLSGLGALGGAASQSKIKPIRAIGTGLSTLVPAIQMMLPESEDQSNINKKNGGRINGYARGKLVEEGGAKIMDMLKNKMAPLYLKSEGVPPPLPRAAPKSDAELMAFAERMAPQVRGDFVRAPGATTSVAGKTRAQFEREKDLQHDIRDVFPLKQVSNYSDANNQGKVKIGIAGDQTLTGKDVYSIAGNPLTEPSRQYGGALYPAAHPQGWASEKGAAQTIQNLADETSAQYGDVDVLGQYLKMGPEASNYSMHNADAIVKSINPNQIKQLDTLNEMIRGRFPDFAGIENQAAILEQARKNPELRKYLDYLVNTKKHAETHGLPSGADMRHALSEPDLRNLEIGATGKSIMQMRPGAKITPSSELATTTYSHDIPGDYVGGTKYARPHELEFADSYSALQNKIATVQDMAKQVVAENPNLDPQAAIEYAKKYGHQGFGGFRMSQPRQIMDQQYMDETGKYEDYMKQLLGFNQGGAVQHFDKGGSPKAKALSSGLSALRDMIKAQDRTPIVPVPNRWFAQPEKFPHVQGMVNKTLDASQLPREAFHSGAFIDPRTGKILDKNIYNDVGVLIDPETGRPMMSAGRESGIDILDPKTGSYTKSNLVRQSLFKPTGGDPMLADMPFIATIEKGDMGHKYALGTEYATPTEMYNTMTGANPTLRPRSRGDVFGMGDVIGQVQVGGRGIPHDVYEKLFVAPKGSDVPGVKLNKANGGKIAKEVIEAFKKKFTPGFYHGSPSNRIKEFDPTKSNKPEEYITPGVTFLTKNPSFAHDYMPVKGSASQMVGQPDQYATGATMYPVSANLGKQFDFDTPEGAAIAKSFLKDTLIPKQGEKDAARWLSGMQDELNTWKSLEHPDFLQHLKDTGHNSFAVREAGIDNVGIFEPKNIRGKFAKYNPEDAESADFMKAAGGSIDGYAPGGKVGALAKLVNKAKFLEQSAVKDRMFHGTTQDISAFDPAKKSNTVGNFNRGMTFVSPNPKLASYYAGKGEGANVMPVHVQVRNPFDYQNPEHVQSLANRIVEGGNYHPSMAAEKAKQYSQDLSSGNWGNIEQANVMKAAQDLGYDAMYMQEHGVKNLGIFDPKRIKSAIGNDNTYDITNPDITKAEGGPVGYAPGGLIKGALSLFKNKTDDVTSKYHPQVQKGLAEGRIDPADAQWMSDYANTPGNSQVETGTGAFKDQSERMQNFLGRIKSGEVKTPSGWEK